MFVALVDFSLRRRLFVLVATAALAIYGVLVATSMPIDLLPDLHPPLVTIVTEAGGFAPEEVEQLVTYPIEMVLNGMQGVSRVRSGSSPGFSVIHVEFDWGTDVFRNRQLVAERLSLVTSQLPRGVVPMLAPPSSATGLIMEIAVTARATSPMALRDVTDWTIRPLLLGVPGVSQIYVVGGDVRQYRFTPNTSAMRTLDITLEQIASALDSFGANTSGGFADISTQEFIIRNVGRTSRLDDLRNIVVAFRNDQPVVLDQVGGVSLTPRVKRGDGSYNGRPAVLLSVLKQPGANTVRVAAGVEEGLRQLRPLIPADVEVDQIPYSQATLVRDSVGNVESILRDAIIIVAIVLIAFMMNVPATLISLSAIPISLLVTILVFHLAGLTINTMTLGGIAIGIGQLVDDAVVNVENMLRRLVANGCSPRPQSVFRVISDASREVRSGVLYATVIVLLVLLPLFFLPGEQGRLFQPLGVAYIVSILASLVTAITVTPALASILLPRVGGRRYGTGYLIDRLKRLNRAALAWSLDHPRGLVAIVAGAVLIALASIFALPRSFLPPFNEGSLYVQILSRPGISLAESNRVGLIAEQLLLTVPEVASVARRTGRNEFDEDADPVNSSELQILLRPSPRGREQVTADIRRRLAVLPVELTVSQFLTSRMEVAATGVRGALVVKIFGDELETLRSLAQTLKSRFAAVPGLVNLLVEPLHQVPQIRIRIDYERAKLFGVTPAAVTQALESLSNGRVVSQIIDQGRRYDVVVRLADADRTAQSLAGLRVETPSGRVALSSIASVEETEGPNRISREHARRRIAVTADIGDADTAVVVGRLRAIMAATPMPRGYGAVLEGTVDQAEQAELWIGGLAAVAVALIFLVLYERYRSTRLALIVMGNIPLALVGSVVALFVWGEDLSLASMIGFITVVGVSARNGVLKISHFINLHLFEGERFGRQLVMRGCEERLAPVLMTALSAGLALVPLLFVSGRPGTEILHTVAVAIFGGLVSSTLLDMLTTPVLFSLYGEEALRRLAAASGDGATVEAF
ncbi:MAG: efflux RND transporter permease subunit [Alphaproteobacteria bacterium]|nr:efflux RND transporter permease subunit [Alphaproteobacteria bacterium]